MIPKILHQVWFGDKPPKKDYQNYTEKWRQLHPDWEYRLWNEENLRDTDCWKYITKFDKYCSRSNAARLYVIMTFGGVYADFDIEWKRNIDELLVHECFTSTEAPNLYCNAFFGSKPNTDWVVYQYNHLKDYYVIPHPWGPRLMTEASNRFASSLFAIDPCLVYPYSWNEKHKKHDNYDSSYVVHHWAYNRSEPLIDDITKFYQMFSIHGDFDEVLYQRQYPELVDFYQPYCKENNIDDKHRLFFHWHRYGKNRSNK
jgi:hypothetical protein